MDPHRRRVQQLVDDASHAALDLFAFMIIKLRQPGLEATQFGGYHVGGHGTQGDNGRGDVGGAAQAEKVGHLFPNEVAGVLDFLGTSNVWLVGD